MRRLTPCCVAACPDGVEVVADPLRLDVERHVDLGAYRVQGAARVLAQRREQRS
ncbi:hypothetical protein [Streptomyces cinerochromogenes]|uniref:hypothetical protein n=1 Tax=Streptomyces cinerochromogenes TaxID=66422 RepID=UPI0033AC68AC